MCQVNTYFRQNKAKITSLKLALKQPRNIEVSLNLQSPISDCTVCHFMLIIERDFSTVKAILFEFRVNTITKTSPCNEDPLTPPLLYSKTGVYRGIHFFLFLL